MTLRISLVLLSFTAPSAAQSDWPQYHGVGSDRRSSERVGLTKWPSSGPPEVWSVSTPRGFSSFAVANGRAFTLVMRELDDVEREVCVAFATNSGHELWAAPIGPRRAPRYDGGGDAGTWLNRGGDGPRSTPSHAGSEVYVLDAHLLLACLDEADGTLRWQRDLVDEFEGRNIRWQNAASPLVDGERVFAAGGGPGRSLLAFDRRSGETLWSVGDELMTHATPVAVTLHGRRQVLFLVQSGLVALAPESGEELWRAAYPYRTSTAASPVVHGDIVYVSAGYGVGAGAFRVVRTEGEWSVEPLWRERNALMNHWSTPVCHDGFLYGMFSFKDYGDGPLQCVELATGKVRWSEEGFGPGNCILVGEHLLALSDAGDVVLIDPSPERYRELAREDVLSGKCWSMPAFSDGQLYVRSTKEGVRLDLSAAGG